MNKISLLVISSVFLLTGCGLFGGGSDDISITPIPPQPTPTPEVTETPETTDNNQGAISTGGLIPATTPQERLRQIEQGRNNPFNSISPPAIIRVREDQTIPFAQLDRAIVRTPAPTIEMQEVTITNQATGNRGISGNQVNQRTGAGRIGADGKMSSAPNLCETENLIEEISIPEPNITVVGVINVNGRNQALIKLGDETGVRQIQEGESIVYDNNVLFVRQIGAYNLQPNITLASLPSFVNFSGGGLSGGVVFTLPDGTPIVRRVGEQPQTQASEATQTQAFKLNLRKEQFNIIQPENNGIKLIKIEDIIPRREVVTSQSNEAVVAARENIEISGIICNNTERTLKVRELVFSLSIGNRQLPSFNAVFQGLSQGDITRGTQTVQEARSLLPGRTTLFRGTVANAPEFNTTEKIDMSLEEWR
ncbi:hypothetical protein ACN4EE_09540 [Geminocystis sp. CENA526]|uniref:hypothetical protein n=1 Tax=Geminocystis sp. CENA526 TaxID=1355871 RepID=UPI003D70239E